MVGAPTSKRCEACRRQKKKCDLNKPACSRCVRLRLKCVGVGMQRYKFVEQAFPGQAAETYRNSNLPTREKHGPEPVRNREVAIANDTNRLTTMSLDQATFPSWSPTSYLDTEMFYHPYIREPLIGLAKFDGVIDGLLIMAKTEPTLQYALKCFGALRALHAQYDDMGVIQSEFQSRTWAGLDTYNMAITCLT
ncbi:hypothetical protein BX600DRAFT_502729, partial [Xylariales sp. PMI_506]